MTDDKRNSLTAEPNEPKQKPDLTLLYKRRCRDGDIIQKCKHLLIAGYSPGRVACLLRLPLEKVKDLHEKSYNAKCRRFAKANAYTNSQLALRSFLEGAKLGDICKALSLPLFTIIRYLRDAHISESEINGRMPSVDDPLVLELNRTIERKASSKYKPIELRHRRKPQQITQQTNPNAD